MARVCDFTGKGTASGNNRSHSMKKSKRSFKPNLIYKMVAMEDGSKVRLKISSKIYKKLKGFI